MNTEPELPQSSCFAADSFLISSKHFNFLFFLTRLRPQAPELIRQPREKEEGEENT